MKKHNIIFTALAVLFFLIIQGPNLVNNFQAQGSIIEDLTIQKYGMKSPLDNDLSIQDQKTVILFWASWCAPCKLEMKRLQSSISSGSIDSKKVWAYNPFENSSTIKKFIQTNDYDFQFIKTDPPLETVLDIKATPTYLWLDGPKVYRMTTGISLINLWWLEYFLAD